ncbi:TPA: hypothetical protein ACRRXW_002180, partial [Morganella morganii]
PEAEYTPEAEYMTAADMTPELLVFRLSGATPEKKSLTLRYYEQEKGAQEKAAQVIGYTGKIRLSRKTADLIIIVLIISGRNISHLNRCLFTGKSRAGLNWKPVQKRLAGD